MMFYKAKRLDLLATRLKIDISYHVWIWDLIAYLMGSKI